MKITQLLINVWSPETSVHFLVVTFKLRRLQASRRDNLLKVVLSDLTSWNAIAEVKPIIQMEVWNSATEGRPEASSQRVT